MEDKVWYLKQINVLKSLSQKDLMELGAQCAMREYKEGDRISFSEESPTIYFLKYGSVKVVNVEETIIELIEAGEIFGHYLTSNPDGESIVRAMEDCLVCFLPLVRWKEIMGNNSGLSYRLLKWTGFRINKLERKLDTLFFKTIHQRIEEMLADLTWRFGKTKDDGWIHINLKITQDQLAQLTGTSRQNVNTYLGEMKGKGWIEYDRKGIRINPEFEKLTHPSAKN